MKRFSNKKFLNYCLALASGVMAFGIAPEAQAITETISGGGVVIDNSGPPANFFELDVNVNSVPDFTIDDVSLTFNNLTHTWAGDLEITLEKVGTGLSADVIFDSGPGGSQSADFDGTYTFEDGGADLTSVALVGSIVPSGTYAPLESFSIFDGETANGLWRLTVNDDAGGDAGGFDSFDLTLSGTAVPATAVPFEFSPTLGLVLLGGGIGLKKSRDRRLKQKSEVDLS